MRRDHFKVENFNEAIGLGLGLSDDTGVIKYNNNFIMIMKKSYRERVEAKRNATFEDSLKRSKKTRGQAIGFDGEEAALAQEIANERSGLDEQTFRAGGGAIKE